jgi:hypothetical protein
MKNKISKLKILRRGESFKKSRFSIVNLAVFALVFVGIGGYLIFRSYAAAPPNISSLPRIPWEGGPNYYKVANGAQFAKADAAGMDDPNFFPIYYFLCDPGKVAQFKAAGGNVCLGYWTNGNLSTLTSNGMFAALQDEEMMGEAAPGTSGWKPSQVGSNPNAVSWFVSDECEMGYSGCTDWANDNGDTGRLAVQTGYVNQLRGYNDGRYMSANFGNGIVRTFWAPNTMDDMVDLMDAAGVDKYAYTSCEVRDLIQNSPDWPAGATTMSSAAYGWQIDQFRMLAPRLRPFMAAIETARPMLGESCAGTITPNQMEGAVWSTLIHEARSVLYFPENNDPNCDDNSTCGQNSIAKQTAINSKVKSLAPVLNTQSYYNDSYVRNGKTLFRYTFNNGTDTMLKTYNGSAYIFADIGLNQSPGSKTFVLPGDVTGTTVTVVGESRTIPVSGGQFTDSFAAEYTHHVYQISMGPPDTIAPTVSVTNPASGAGVSGGSVTLSANASDDNAVAGVQFKVDGTNVGTEDTASPYSITWNSTSVANGAHTITAVARDNAGNTTTSSGISVTVSNTPDTTPPTVSITAPTAGSTVSGGSVTVSASASDNVGVAGVQFKVDGSNVGSEDTTSSYSISWDSASVANGTHTIAAVARDGAGNSTTSSSISVTVNNAASNLTIGESNILQLDDSGNGNLLIAQQATLSQTATIQSMSFYVSTAAGKLRLGVYDATGPSGGPGAKKAETAEITPVVGWNTANVTTPASLTAGTYWLAYLSNDNNLHFRVDGSGTERHYSFAYGTMPNTFSASPTSSTSHWSLYASLVSGGINPTPPPPPPSGSKQGDINGDNSVNITDLSLLLSSYGQSTTQCVTNNTYTCDLSSPGDGIVNIFDLSILLSKYGT